METQNFEETSVRSREIISVTSSGVDLEVEDQVADERVGREVFKRFPAKAKFSKVGTCTWEFCLLASCQVYVPTSTSHVAYPPVRLYSH